MGHPLNIVPCIALKTTLPIDIRAKLDLHLFSDVEGRVPKGAYQRLLVELLNQYFDNKALDLSPYIGVLPGTHIVKGSPHTIGILKAILEEG